MAAPTDYRIAELTNNGLKDWGYRYDGNLYTVPAGKMVRLPIVVAEHLMAHAQNVPEGREPVPLAIKVLDLMKSQQPDLGPHVDAETGKSYASFAELTAAIRERVVAEIEGAQRHTAAAASRRVMEPSELDAMSEAELKAEAKARGLHVVPPARPQLLAAIRKAQDG